MSEHADRGRPGRDLTQLLRDWNAGDREALDRLIPLVYDELRRLARRELRRERVDHTVQPTALVNELYLRLLQQRDATWQNRAQFFAIAAQLMRRVLVDHARARVAAKRGGGAPRVSLDAALELPAGGGVDLLALDRELTRLAELDPDQARIVELRFFSGLTIEETAAAVGRSPRTVKREWRLARAWLYGRLGS